jgi:hypothetical protein
MTVKLPGSPPLAASLKPSFLQQTAQWGDKLELMRGTNIAALD